MNINGNWSSVASYGEAAALSFAGSGRSSAAVDIGGRHHPQGGDGGSGGGRHGAALSFSSENSLLLQVRDARNAVRARTQLAAPRLSACLAFRHKRGRG
jgi:hypothetical protein